MKINFWLTILLAFIFVAMSIDIYLDSLPIKKIHLTHIISNEQVFKVGFGTYGDSAAVIITDDDDEAFDFIKKYSDSTIEMSVVKKSDGITCSGGNGIPTVWLRKTEIPIVNHEIFHLTWYVMKTVGILLSDETEEAYAYEYDYLSSQIYNNIKITK